MLAWKTLLLRCWSKASLVGGILSTSLVFCENNLILTRSTSLSSFDSSEYSLQTKFVATSFSLGDVLNGVSTMVANSSMRNGTLFINLQQDRFPLNLKEDVLSDPVNAWKSAMALHVVVPRFVAMVFREIILVVFPALKEIQISASAFRAIMWWKLLRRITTSVSPVCTIPSDDVWRAWRWCTRTLVSASSWLHWSIGEMFPTWWTWSCAVT